MPSEGSLPIKVPNYKNVCLTLEEAEKVYDCVDKDYVVSPIVFSKGFQPPLESVREEYKLLETFLNEGREVPNPYEVFLMNQVSQDKENTSLVDPYYPGAKMQNTHRMSEWSVFGTRMSYTTHPQQVNNGMVLNRCDDKVYDTIVNRMGKPELVKVADTRKEVLNVFEDSFEEVGNYLHLTSKFNDARDIATTHLGMEGISLKDRFTPELSFPIYSNCHTWGQVVGGSPLEILIDSGTSKCYMSKNYYMKNIQLHSLPKYASTISRLKVGNGAMVVAHFIIPVVFRVLKHKFEMFALVSDIEPSVDFVWGVKNMFEVEGELSIRNSEFRFMNRAVPLFCTEHFH